MQSLSVYRSYQLPHVILKGQADLSRFISCFQPCQRNEAGWILKLRCCYLSSDTSKLLFDCTAVRSGFSQDFYIRTEQKQGSVTVRVDPTMRIERNEGVHRCVLMIAAQLLEQQSECLILDKSNLPPEILAGLSGVLPA
ncbi:MAG: hypothetical protein ACR2IE_16465 [Candidatus Sumerlaeaceae bacterium]